VNPAAKRLFPHWEEIADDSVAHLRATVGYRPDDPALRALVADLGAESPAFAQRWERRDVRPCHSGRKVFEHPMVGRLELDYRVLDIPATCHHRLVVYSAIAGSVDFRALGRLSHGCPESEIALQASRVLEPRRRRQGSGRGRRSASTAR
jgi:hypothetical protein